MVTGYVTSGDCHLIVPLERLAKCPFILRPFHTLVDRFFTSKCFFFAPFLFSLSAFFRSTSLPRTNFESDRRDVNHTFADQVPSE